MKDSLRRSWKRLKAFVLCLVAGQTVAIQSVQANESTGLIGARLASVEKTHDLFTFFHLTHTGSEDLPNRRTLVTYKPDGAAFRALVTLAVTTDEQGIIERLQLEVARSFIDDARQGIFAADLVKSFLASVGTASTPDDIATLANEIHARSMMNSGQTVLTAQPVPSVSKQPSAAYQTYAGKGPAQTLANRAGSVRMSAENNGQSGMENLEIVLAAVRH